MRNENDSKIVINYSFVRKVIAIGSYGYDCDRQRHDCNREYPGQA